jgi:hypothetical protein
VRSDFLLLRLVMEVSSVSARRSSVGLSLKALRVLRAYGILSYRMTLGNTDLKSREIL